MALVAPSILSANFNDLKSEVEEISDGGADYIHLDIMDGHFVPNLTFGPVVVQNLKQITDVPLDAHLMVYSPENYIEKFAKLGVSMLSVQYEATAHLDRVLDLIKQNNMQCAVAINPATPVEAVYPVLPIVDMVIVMSVNPGFGGQKFIPYTLNKIKQLKKQITSQNVQTMIQIDGGVTLDNAQDIVSAGADILVAGSTIFNSKDRKNVINVLKNVH